MEDNDKSRLLENALDAVVGCDESEFVIYWNRRAEELFGWTKSEVIGRKMAELIVPERFREAHRRGMTRFLATGTSRVQNQRLEVPAIAKDGREFTVELTITSMRDADGRHRFYSFLRDISPLIEVRRAGEDIKNLQQRFARSAAAIDLGVWYCDLPLDKLNWSPAVRRHFFMDLDVEIDREAFYARLHPDDRARTYAAVEATLTKNVPYDIVYRTFNPDDPNEVRWIRSVGWLDRDETGAARRFDGVTRDVTNEYTHRIELEKARDEAERANRMKSTFLANMSHEIRTPLGAMLGFAQLLRDPNVSAKKREEYLDVLLENGEALSKIINDVLDLSKIEAGHLEVAPEHFDLRSLIEEIVALFRLEAEKRGLKLRADLLSGDEFVLFTDRGRLRQILLNLVNNALKFTPTGAITLHVRTQEADGLVAVDVIDTGIGISSAEAERIFEAFEQADNTTTRRFGGTGLGLALCRSLARQLGGDVMLMATTVERGSTFRVTVRSAPESANAGPRKREAGPAETHVDLSGTRVLVADDSPDNRFLLTELLEREGVEVTCACDGREACAHVGMKDFDLVLMDIQMPGLDGYAATREISKLAKPPPIIAVTAHALDEDRLQSQRAGCVDHLTKPIKAAELIRMIQRHRRSPTPAL